ncbi:MAG: hypothetical protein ACODAD_11865, partial [Planctomycetota bacterium]
YSCYDVIVVTARDVEEMTPQVHLALRRYLECGGTVLVHGQQVPDVFSKGGMSVGQETYRVGFGVVVASLAEGSSGQTTYKKLENLHIRNYQPKEKPRSLYELLVAETTVPVRGLFLLVLLFGLLIGPANLWLLSRIKRRIWIWWNVPAMSLATCLIVFVYSVASEGITGQGKRATLTLLDERCHRATTIGYVSYYCPLTPSSGPRFDVDTDVALLSEEDSGLRSPRDNLRVVDWTRDQHLSSGWVRARVPTYFQIRKNEDRRERLTIERRSEGELKAVNALGADIRRLYVADRTGKIFVARQIPAGAEETLEAVPRPAVTQASRQKTVRDIFRDTHWLDDFKQWSERDVPHDLLSPGCYIAFLDNTPFIEPALSDVDPEDTVAIVHGISEEQDDGR